MKKVLVLLFLSINAFSSDSVVFKEGADVPGWLDNPGALVSLSDDNEPIPCKNDEVEYKGILYSTWNPMHTVYFYPLFFKYGNIPPGLWVKSLIKDSSLYVVEAGICFDKSKHYNIPDNDTITKIPLKLIFPESKSDTVHANFFTNQLDVVNKNGELFFAFRKGKVAYIMDRKSWNLKIYDQFDQNESENCNTPATLRFECDNPPISEYFKLMDRLKPYYFKVTSKNTIIRKKNSVPVNFPSFCALHGGSSPSIPVLSDRFRPFRGVLYADRTQRPPCFSFSSVTRREKL